MTPEKRLKTEVQVKAQVSYEIQQNIFADFRVAGCFDQIFSGLKYSNNLSVNK